MMKEPLVKQRSPAPPLSPTEPEKSIRILGNKRLKKTVRIYEKKKVIEEVIEKRHL